MDFYANATFPIINGSQAVCEGFGPYLRDESRMPGGRADALVFPRTENEMAAVLENAFQSGTPITLSGGRTGIVGGAVPFGGLLMSLDQFDRFLGVRWDDKRQSWTVRIQPGMRIETLEALIQKRIAPESVAADDAL
ncbi:MAG TPA: FAD-binding protein, partial [bacterium]